MKRNHRQLKGDLYEQFARIGKALASPKRLELLDLLSQGPRTVEDIAEHAAVSVANASQHLQVLRAARLVESEKSGLYVRYSLADEGVYRFFQGMRELAASRLAEVKQAIQSYFDERDEMETVSGKEIIRRMRQDKIVLLDVRPVEEYRAGHLPKAVSIPVSELRKRLKELPKNREIIAYCRGPYCVMAVEAVKILRDKGYRAIRLEDGVMDWQAKGGRVESERKDEFL